MKKAQGGTGANQHSQGGHNVHSAKTAAVVAEQYGVDEKTVRRDAAYAAAVDTRKAGREPGFIRSGYPLPFPPGLDPGGDLGAEIVRIQG